MAEETSDTGSDASSGSGIALEYVANASVECHTDPNFEHFPQGVCSLVYHLRGQSACYESVAESAKYQRDQLLLI